MRSSLASRLALVAALALSATLSPVFARQVVFSEVMYNPAENKPEFIEVWNLTSTPLDAAQWRFTDGISFVFPDFNGGAVQDHFLKPFERILISSADAATTRAAYPSIPAAVRIFGPWTGLLDNAGERITLVDKNGVGVVSSSYKDAGHWPAAADGAGHSLVLANENGPVDDWRNWRRSSLRHGSPGTAEVAVPRPLELSELHFSEGGRLDWVEVRNGGNSNVSTTDLFVASLPDFTNKVALGGDLAGGTYASYDVDFPTDNDGDVRLYLIDGSNNVLADADLRRVPGRPSLQAFPAGAGEWYSSPAPSPGAANDPPRQTSVVINEIMADPPSNQRDAEFIELYNKGPGAVDLSGWRLDEAVDFVFPAGTSIPAGAYIVVAARASSLNASYPGLNAMGDWSGELRNGGELIRLLDQAGNLADSVDYRLGGDWPELAAGNGSSLELVHPDADNSVGSAWRDSDESAKSVFQPFSITASYARSAPAAMDDELRLWLVGDGHLVLRNIVLRPTAGGPNRLANAAAVTETNENVTGWLTRGTHWASFSDAEGVHLKADGHGDNKANHAEKDAAGMLAGSHILEFEARWVYGKSRLIAQTWDTTWGGSVLVPIPANLGTPGAVNSRLTPEPAPQIAWATHAPAVPLPNQPVTITARVSSAAPLSAVEVVHRPDSNNPNAAWSTIAMNDNGLTGDTVAGDGVWTALISNYPTNKLIVQFYVRATAANTTTANYPKLGAAAPGLWIVDSQAVPQTLRRLRVVISQYWLNALNSSAGNSATYKFKYPRLSNRYFPCTLINNEKEVFYGATVRKTGSPWTRQDDSGLTRARVTIPTDRGFRGQQKLYWDNDAGTSLRHNRITRYWLYLLGVPGNENEFIRVMRNGDSPTVRESSEVFDKEMLDRIFDRGRDGNFYEIDDTFYIGDDGSARLGNVDGNWGYKGESPNRYQNSFIPKSRESEYDFGGLIEWTRQLTNNGAALTQSQLERMADTQMMAAYAAVRGYIGDWDNITLHRGKNGYFYQRPDGRFMLMHWDSDLAFGNANESILGGLQNVATYYNKPFVKRQFHFYLTEILNKYSINSPRMAAWIAAESSALPTNPVDGIYNSWFTSRNTPVRNMIAGSLNAPFALTNPAATTAANVVTFTGTAPTTAFRVEVDGHPEAGFAWTTERAWTLQNLRLASGANTLTFRMRDAAGIQVGTELVHTITKDGNAPPAVALTFSKESQNVGLGESITFDAGASVDPEGTPLTFVWSATPTAGFSISAPSPTVRTVVFSQPGIYTFGVQATDADGQTAALFREVTVFDNSDFDSFGAPFLDGRYTIQNTEARDNDSPDGWYALDDRPGALLLHVADNGAKPLAPPPFRHPLITRRLPADTDWALETEVTLVSRQFGSFSTGLFVETVEGGTPAKYAFGIENGSLVSARRSVGGGNYALIASLPFTGTGQSAVLRVQRVGLQLFFHWRVNGVWQSVATQSIDPTSSSVGGGVFAATTLPQSVRVAFDYLLLSDPRKSANLVQNLRVTEIMYQPPAGGVEFIEVTNIGATALNLDGAYFDQDNPFDRFTFGALTLEPGAATVVTSNRAAFASIYGAGLLIAGQFSGALNNSGERIVLKDAAGNVIQDFSYGVGGSWPARASGGGSSLVALFTNGNYNDPLNWGASDEQNGNPGGAGTPPDTDHDGQMDTFEVLAGSDSRNAASLFVITSAVRTNAGDWTVTWPGAAGRTYTVEMSTDLSTGVWTPLANLAGTPGQMTYTDLTAPGQNQRFYRVAARRP